MTENKLWLCGQLKGGTFPHSFWDFQGIFSTREKASQACRDINYFIYPVQLDLELPDETVEPPGLKYYPFKWKES